MSFRPLSNSSTSRDVYSQFLNDLSVQSRLQIPRKLVASTPVFPVGNVLIDKPSKIPYYSDGLAWLPFGSGVPGTIRLTVYSPQVPEYQPNATFSSLESAVAHASTLTLSQAEQVTIVLFPGTHLIGGGTGTLTIPKYVNISGWGGENRIGPVIIVGGLVYDIPIPFVANDFTSVSNVTIINDQTAPAAPCINIICSADPAVRPSASDFILGISKVGLIGTNDAIVNLNGFSLYVTDCLFQVSGVGVRASQAGVNPFVNTGFLMCINNFFVGPVSPFEIHQCSLFCIANRFLTIGAFNIDLLLDSTTFAGGLFVLTGCSAIFLPIVIRGGGIVVISDSDIGFSSITIDNTARLSDDTSLQVRNSSFGSISASNLVGLINPPSSQTTKVQIYNCIGSSFSTNTTGGGVGGAWTVDNCTFENFTLSGPSDSLDLSGRVYASISNTKFLATTGFSQNNIISGNYLVDLQGVKLGTTATTGSVFPDVAAKIFVTGLGGIIQWGTLTMESCFSRMVWHDDVGSVSGVPTQFWRLTSCTIENPFPPFFGFFNPIRCGPNMEIDLNNVTLKKEVGFSNNFVLGSTISPTTVFRGEMHFRPLTALAFGGNLGFLFSPQGTVDDNTVVFWAVPGLAIFQTINIVTAAAVIVTLPAIGASPASPNPGLFVTVKDRSGVGTLVAPSVGDTIDGGGAVVIPINGSRTFIVRDTVEWILVSTVP